MRTISCHVDTWWNNLEVSQKQLVRLIAQMAFSAKPGQVVELTPSPGKLVTKIVDRRPQTRGLDRATFGAT